MAFEIDGGILYRDGFEVSLPFPVAEGINSEQDFVVRLAVPAGESFNRNVLLVSESGDTVWQIQESPHGTESDKPFMRIWKDDDGSIVAGNWNGVDYTVDPGTGAIVARSFRR